MSDNSKIDKLQEKIANLEKENAIINKKLTHIQEIYNNTTIGLYRTNIEGEILNANPPLVKMMGFSTFKELQSHNLNNKKLISLEERTEFLSTMRKKGVIIGKEAIWLKKDSEKIYVRESSKAIKDKNGDIRYFEGTVEDITEQKNKEKELKEIEIFYKRLVEALPNGIVIHKDSKIVYANEYAENALLSKQNPDNITYNVYDFIHPDYHKKVKERLSKTEKEFKQASITEQVFLTSKGVPLHAEVVTIPYKNKGETFLLTVFSDITDRKLAEKELKLSEVTYRGMLNSISEAIFIQNIDGDFLDINKTAETLFDYPNEFFQGKNPRHLEIPGKNDFAKILEKIKAAYNGKRQIFDFWGQKRDGTEFQAEVTLVSGIYFDKKVVIAVVRDITERKLSEQALKDSEKRYRHLINFAVGGILIGSQEGIIIEGNTHMYKLLGRKRNEIIGKHITDGFFTKDSLVNEPIDFEKVKKGKTVIKKRVIQRPDGSTLPVEMHSKALPDGTYQSIYHDISERLKVDQEILEAKSKAEALNLHKDALLTALPDMLFTFNSEGIVIDFYSNSYEDLVIEPKYFLNKSIKNFIPIEIANRTITHIKSVLKTKKEEVFQYNIEVEEKVEYFDAKMVFFQEDTVLCVIRNITERMELIRDLQTARKKAEESDNLKSAFLSNLSHEIRTPMNGILGFTELLKDDLIKGERLEYLDIIEKSCNQLLLILDDIIEIAKIEAGLINKRNETIEINLFIKDIYSQMQGLFTKKDNLKFILSENIPIESINSITDSIKLKQILSNFISNSFKFTKTGYIELGYQLISDTYIMFYVKDTGVGISSENQEKIFKRFIQIENNMASLSRGSGLGLSICKAYAEILNGEILLDSELGKGSCFYLKIPIISLN